MSANTNLHYLEIVTPDVEQLCDSYSQSLGVPFSEPVPELGNARTAPFGDGGSIGIRAPMHDAEEPATRPYYLVEDIVQAVEAAEKTGAMVAVPPMDIPGRGKCAVLMYGATQSGLWQI